MAVKNSSVKLSPMIDEPSPYATLESWERHLKIVEALPESGLKPEMLKRAREMIAEKRG